MLYINRIQKQEEVRKIGKVGNLIVKSFIQGLDYGFMECRCYKNSVRLGYDSIEGELSVYELHMCDEFYIEIIEHIKQYFSKYEDIQLVRDSDEFGEFIEVQRVEV